MRRKTSTESYADEVLGYKLKLFHVNLEHLMRRKKITHLELGGMFGFSPAQVQKWEKGGGMPASALYIIRSTGQSIDAFIDQGQPTLTAEQFFALLDAWKSKPKTRRRENHKPKTRKEA
jgi:hypothetical protein